MLAYPIFPFHQFQLRALTFFNVKSISFIIPTLTVHEFLLFLPKKMWKRLTNNSKNSRLMQFDMVSCTFSAAYVACKRKIHQSENKFVTGNTFNRMFFKFFGNFQFIYVLWSWWLSVVFFCMQKEKSFVMQHVCIMLEYWEREWVLWDFFRVFARDLSGFLIWKMLCFWWENAENKNRSFWWTFDFDLKLS